DTALLTVRCYNNIEKKRSCYGVPYTVDVFTNHIWRPLVEKAGYKMEDIPKTWDAYYDFFKEVQKKLRAQGVRSVYGLGFQVTTNGNDTNAFHAKTIVMDLDGSLSTEVAIIKNQQDYNDIVTMGLPLGNDGKPVP